MATTTIKDGFNGGSDNQAYVDSTGALKVTGGGSGGTISANLTEVSGAAITLGQTTESASLPVTIASDQSPISVTGSIIATNSSIGTNGSAAPNSSTQVAAQNASGLLVPLMVDPSGKLLVDTSGTSTVTGTVDANINGLNVFQTSQYTVGLTVVQLTVTPLTNRSSMSIKATCSGSNAIFIGNSNAVTTSTGFPLFNGDVINLDLTGASKVWAIASSANQTLYIMEIAY